jgi:hypothetical protein
MAGMGGENADLFIVVEDERGVSTLVGDVDDALDAVARHDANEGVGLHARDVGVLADHLALW